jgi:hypothetical protein
MLNLPAKLDSYLAACTDGRTEKGVGGSTLRVMFYSRIQMLQFIVPEFSNHLR